MKKKTNRSTLFANRSFTNFLKPLQITNGMLNANHMDVCTQSFPQPH